MKKIVTTLLVSLFSLVVFGQSITGQWNGILKVPGMQLRIVFHITQTGDTFSATMDSPDQGAAGIPVTSTSFENSVLKIAITNAAIEYEGVLGEDERITGNFKQRGYSFPLNLSKEKVEIQKPVRPQDPLKPYPYNEEEVFFENTEDGVKLAGTFTFPQTAGAFPAVVLISGSGAQNRDEELMGHKPFLVLADYLTRNGIAVLRFDDRGTASSTGDFRTATSFDFSKDVEAGVKYLQTRKEVNPKQIGLVGHSEGGIIAPMLASRSTDVAFIVLLAGTGIQGDKLLLLQQEALGKASGMDEAILQQVKTINAKAFEIVIQSTNQEQLESDLTLFLRQVLKDKPGYKSPTESEEDWITNQIQQVANPWLQYFIKFDPAPVLEKVKCPVLAINGEKDLQVPAQINLEAIQAALLRGGNKNSTIKELPHLNHLFQECETGSPDEYETIEQTISPIALTEILEWIKLQTR
jgi:pimeloyl-ACP methyl ester carboxylesterase